MLADRLEKIKDSLPETYRPFPAADDRAFWENTPDSMKTTYLTEAEKYLAYDFPVLPATVFMEFTRIGNRSNYQKIYSVRRKALNVFAMAELFENKGRFIDPMIDLIWMICEETTWILPAHNTIIGYQDERLPLPDFDRPIIALLSADTAASISLALYFFKAKFDAVSPQIYTRAAHEIRERILKPYRSHMDYWWMGFIQTKDMHLNNWNPWVNSNVLLTLLLLENNITDHYYTLRKITKSLDKYMEGQPKDGGCDEGPGYWDRAGASLFECLEILYEYTDGRVDIFSEPKIRNMCRFYSSAHISGNYFVNFADAGAKAFTSPALLYSFGKYIKDRESMAFAVEFSRTAAEFRPLGAYVFPRILRELLLKKEMSGFTDSYEPRESVFFENIEVAYMRGKTESGNLFLGVKGGNNFESHNHNDIGNFTVYANGLPFIIDTGSMIYTRKTFSSDRYDIWVNKSLWHNVPEINGMEQSPGPKFKSSNTVFSNENGRSVFTTEIQGAYPQDSGITIWKRSASLDHGTGIISIKDSFKLKTEGDIRFTLMCHPKPQINGNEILLNADGTKMVITADPSFRISYETIELDDENLERSWGDKLYRISLHTKSPVKSGNYRMDFKLT